MTNRDRDIIKAALDAAHEADAQLSDVALHSVTNKFLRDGGKMTASLGEFELAMKLADATKLFIGVPARFGSGRRWTITAEGEAARIEMERA